jgi:hypothetical protein
MKAIRSSFVSGVIATLLLVTPVAAAPAEQSVEIDVTPARLTVFPLGSARVQMVISNPSSAEQVFALEILLVKADGSIATAFLSDALAMAPGVTTTAIYSIKHADGAVEAVVTPRRWPELSQ